MNKERLRKDVYEMVWAKLTQQLKMLIAIEEDPEDDKLDDIEALISVSKYYGTFSWVLSREGQELQIHALDNGNVTLVIEEQVHRTIVIKLNYENDSNELLTTVENTIVDFIQIFYTGNWHILADYLIFIFHTLLWLVNHRNFFLTKNLCNPFNIKDSG